MAFDNGTPYVALCSDDLMSSLLDMTEYAYEAGDVAQESGIVVNNPAPYYGQQYVDSTALPKDAGAVSGFLPHADLDATLYSALVGERLSPVDSARNRLATSAHAPAANLTFAAPATYDGAGSIAAPLVDPVADTSAATADFFNAAPAAFDIGDLMADPSAAMVDFPFAAEAAAYDIVGAMADPSAAMVDFPFAAEAAFDAVGPMADPSAAMVGFDFAAEAAYDTVGAMADTSAAIADISLAAEAAYDAFDPMVDTFAAQADFAFAVPAAADNIGPVAAPLIAPVADTAAATVTQVHQSPVKRGRGRPKGAKNKTVEERVEASRAKARGRPLKDAVLRDLKDAIAGRAMKGNLAKVGLAQKQYSQACFDYSVEVAKYYADRAGILATAGERKKVEMEERDRRIRMIIAGQCWHEIYRRKKAGLDDRLWG